MGQKKGILIVSFGTSHLDTMDKTIAAIENEAAAAFPECRIYRAFTSRIIVKKLRETEDILIHDMEGALKQMRADGIETVMVQPTYIVNGLEYDKMVKELEEYTGWFQAVRIGKPLLSSTEDYKKSIHVVAAEAQLGDDEVLILMGHGTNHHANSAYPTLEYTAHFLGYRNVLVGTVNEFPNKMDVIAKLGVSGYRKVKLMPFLLTAGRHAKKDMEFGEDSWKAELESEGYSVTVISKGLGEMEGIRKLFIAHLEELM